ncbi:unnamed protein product [Rhizopus stolonifer]
MWIKTLALFLTLSTVLGCEMPCRRGVSQNFADYYTPVVQMSVDSLQQQLSSSVQRITLPSDFSRCSRITPDLINRQFEQFVRDDALKNKLAQGFYQVIFNEELPYKGDCNNPKRLNRKMPPEGESWTIQECQKMDYRCGNPPSICHFLDDVKQRCIGRMRRQLAEYVSVDNGSLVKKLVRDARQSILTNSGQSSRSTEIYVTKVVSSIISTLDHWVSHDLPQLCETPEQEEACNSWDDKIKLNILQWP